MDLYKQVLVLIMINELNSTLLQGFGIVNGSLLP